MGEEDEDGVDIDVEDDGESDFGLHSLPVRQSIWALAGIAANVVRNIFVDIADGFHGVEIWLDQRATWEEERQEFSDSVKSDFLVIKTLESTEQEG